jgi:hypothetical protein
MKKVLATVAALGLVLGVTATAFALDQPGRVSESEATTAPRVAAPTAPGVALWSVAGNWALAGAYINKGMGGFWSGGNPQNPGGAGIISGSNIDGEGLNLDPASDAWYLYSFKILPVLQINDKIAVKGEIRFVDRNISGTSGTSDAGLRDADFKHIYMEWTSPWGKTRFGRTPAGAWGSKFIDNTAQGDRLMWWLNMLPENWGMLLFTQKIQENDSNDGIPNTTDEDWDGYYADISYKADFGKTTAALFAVRRANLPIQDNVTTTNLWVHGNYNFNPIAVEYELNFAFGDGLPEPGYNSSSDQKGWGAYVDASYKMEDWTFGGIFFMLTGDDNLTDNTNEALFSSAGTGIDFNPYQILTGDYMSILNPDKGAVHPAINQNGETIAGVWSLGAYAKLALSPQLSINGVIGYAAATDEPSGWDSEYGWELGAGMDYKIMDNLTYSAHFSYMLTGDFFSLGNQADVSTEDVYLLAHALTMNF